MNKRKGYIEELFTDSSPIDEKSTVQALKYFITIQRDSKDIYFKNEKDLTVEDTILIYGLTKKLLNIRGLVGAEEISASEIYQKTGIKKGSIDSAFNRLRGKYIVGRKKNYVIPNFKVNEIIENLKNIIKLSEKTKKGEK